MRNSLEFRDRASDMAAIAEKRKVRDKRSRVFSPHAMNKETWMNILLGCFWRIE